MRTVYLLTTGSGDDGDEWHVESIHDSREGAEAAKAEWEKPVSRGDGTSYCRQACVEEWPMQEAITPKECSRVSLEPGDKIVIHYDRCLSPSARENLREELRRVFGDHQVVILTEGATMSIVRPAKPDLRTLADV